MAGAGTTVYEFSSGQVTYTTVGNTGAATSAIPIVLSSPSDLAANNMVVYPGGGYISTAEYDALVANATSDPTPSFSLELYAEFKGGFSLATYSGIDTHDLVLEVAMGKFGSFAVPLYCYNKTVSTAFFNASSIMCFDTFDDTLPAATSVLVYDNAGYIPSFTGVVSFRINYRSQ